MAGSMRLARPGEVTNPCARGRRRAAIDVTGIGTGMIESPSRVFDEFRVTVEFGVECRFFFITLLEKESGGGVDAGDFSGRDRTQSFWKGQLRDQAPTVCSWDWARIDKAALT